jgi:hypothetical protein
MSCKKQRRDTALTNVTTHIQRLGVVSLDFTDTGRLLRSLRTVALLRAIVMRFSVPTALEFGIFKSTGQQEHPLEESDVFDPNIHASGNSSKCLPMWSRICVHVLVWRRLLFDRDGTTSLVAPRSALLGELYI